MDMDNSGSSATAAIITGVSSIAAAIIGAVALISKGKWWGKKPSTTPKADTNITSQTGDGSTSFIAVGENITQHHGTVHNYYAEATQDANAFSSKVESRPTIAEIMDDLNKERKPYEASQIPKHYVGIPVSWPVTVSGVWEFPRTWVVRLASPSNTRYAALVDIDINDYPNLRVVEGGYPAWVEGRIRTVAETGEVYLEDGAQITLG